MLEALGNLGDFLGGIGVFVTLIYLATQIRQNTLSVRASAYQGAQRDIADKLDSLSHDPELLRLYFEGNRNFDRLSEDDRRRYATFMAGLMRRYETLLYQTRVGNMSRADWEGSLAELRTTFKYAGTRSWWSKARQIFSADLRRLVDEELLGSDAPRPSG